MKFDANFIDARAYKDFGITTGIELNNEPTGIASKVCESEPVKEGGICASRRINLDFVRGTCKCARSQGGRGGGIPFSALKIATRPTPTAPLRPSLLSLPVSPDSNA